MRVLFCTDGSDISFNALKNFSKWGRDAIIDAICVVDWSFLPDEIVVEGKEFENSCSNIAISILDKVTSEVLGLGLTFGEKIKYCGETVSCILEQTQKTKYDLILMGSHGKKGIQRWLGSVSRDIVNNAETATYISKNINCAHKVLFAADGSSNSRFAFSEAIKYLDLRDKEIYICVVQENPSLLFLEGALDSRWLMEIEEQQSKYSTRIILALQEQLKKYDIKADKFTILQGNPAEKIAEFSKKENIDLIVTGTRQVGKNVFHGSVSKRILEISPADVVIFK